MVNDLAEENTEDTKNPQVKPKIVMNTQIGAIHEYHQGEDVNVYIEQLNQYFISNEVQDENKKKAALLSCMGSSTYKLLRDLCSPRSPAELQYEDLRKMLVKHLSPPVIVFKERYEFYKASRSDDQTIADWYVKVKKLAIDCKFGQALQTKLIDKFVTGINHPKIFDRLCEESENLELDKAFELATKYELQFKVQQSSQVNQVNLIKRKSQRRKKAASGNVVE